MLFILTLSFIIFYVLLLNFTITFFCILPILLTSPRYLRELVFSNPASLYDPATNPNGTMVLTIAENNLTLGILFIAELNQINIE